MTPRRLDAEGLELGGGLEILLAAALEGLAPGGRIEVVSASRGTALELHGWARRAGHSTVGERLPDGGPYAVVVERGPTSRVLADAIGPRGRRPPLRGGADGGDHSGAGGGDRSGAGGADRSGADGADRSGAGGGDRSGAGGGDRSGAGGADRSGAGGGDGGEFHTGDLRRGEPVPATADPRQGFTPVGAVAELGAPQFDWLHNDRDRLWADDVAELAEQATRAQWDASRDVPWEAARDLPDFMERAVAQVMTFIAQNEYAALYVPAAFLPHVNPAYAEVVMWLAGHIHDEARHIEVFTKRALIGGYAGQALASTELSLQTLLEERDFSGAALLLNVLGEGTFLDLLAFVERHAPDAATHAAAHLAHRDEVRHVHFGISHVRRRMAGDPDMRASLVAAAERRAEKLVEMSGLSPLLGEGLTIMAAGSMQPAELAEGARAVRDLMQTMEENRIKRLQAAGFDAATATYLSELHTPNLM